MQQSLSPFGGHTQKYWDRRYSLFSRWDEGILTDAEGLYSVKPEAFALEIAARLPGDTVLDAFCGIGGSAIGFARAGKRVITVDTEAARLDMARHNAALYGVEDLIEFIQGDILELYETLAFDALHIDPPWGGPDYYRKESFSWADFAPNPLGMIRPAIAAGKPVALGLPVNFSTAELDELPIVPLLEDAWDTTRVMFRTAYFLPPVEA
jgi:trimethylguanosine synthase